MRLLTVLARNFRKEVNLSIGKRLSEKNLEYLIKRKKEGVTNKLLAEMFGISMSAVYHQLKKAGLVKTKIKKGEPYGTESARGSKEDG